MNILMIGDVIGNPGRHALRLLMPSLRKEYNIDMVVANAENSAGGIGVTPETAGELLDSNIDILTSGNHIWAHREMIPYLDSEMPVLRPLNYPPGVPGRGFITKNNVLIVNLVGRTFMNNLDCPFRAMDKLLSEIKDRPPVVIVDFHAEATSEKVAMGRYLDGRVSAVIGTHTHVQTADEQIFPGGTAFLSDGGFTGPHESVLGREIEPIIRRFMTNMPQKFEVAKDRVLLQGAVVEIDEQTGQAKGIQRVSQAL
jgi:metallophosphoesterase (TIGR00282 family)